VEPPEELIASAYRRTDTGEYAWERSEALRAAQLLASRGHAIVGGEAWMILGGQVYLLRDDREDGYYLWECVRQPRESWVAFVARSLQQAEAAISDDGPLQRAEVPPRAEVYYNLTWAPEKGASQV
jgi:hypothetical protein